MHNIAQALAWLDAHDVAWSIVILFVAMFATVGAASTLERAVWWLTHRREICEERELAARVQRLRG